MELQIYREKINMNKTPKGKPRFDRELCIACTMCANICPTGAIDLEIRNSINGFRRFPVVADKKNASDAAPVSKNVLPLRLKWCYKKKPETFTKSVGTGKDKNGSAVKKESI